MKKAKIREDIIYRNFWKLYGAGVFGHDITDFTPLNREEWKRMRRLASRKQLAGFILDGTMHLPEDRRPPREMLDKWGIQVALETRNHWENNLIIADLFRHWRAAGLHPVLLKGQGFARLYENPYHRMIGDIDIFICQSEWDKAMEVVNSLDLDDTAMPDGEKHLCFHYRRRHVELHHHSAHMVHNMHLDAKYQEISDSVMPISKDGFYVDANGMFADSGDWITIPPVSFNPFYTFAHMWGHLYIGMAHTRSLSDWLMLLKDSKGKYDEQELKRQLEDFELMWIWKKIGAFAVKYMNADPEIIPFYDPDGMGDEKKFYRYMTRELTGFGFLSHSDIMLWRKFCNLRYRLVAWHNCMGIFPRDMARRRVIGLFTAYLKKLKPKKK